MKIMRLNMLIMLCICLCAIGCSKRNEVIPNSNPSAVTVTTYVSGNIVDVSWTNATDPDNDEVSYSIELSGTIVVSELSSNSYELSNLEVNETFQAKLIVTDTEGGQSESPFSFTTETLIKTDGSPETELVEYASLASDGGVMVVGRGLGGAFTGAHLGSTDVTVIKYDGLGNIEWKKSFGGSNDEAASRITRLSDNSHMITGFTNSPDGDFSTNNAMINAFALRISEQGGVISSYTYGGSNEDAFTGVVETNDNNLMFCGIARSSDGDISSNNGQSDFWVVKTTFEGTILWEKTYGGTAQDNAYAIVSNGDGTYTVAGGSQSSDGDFMNNYGNRDAQIMRIDGDGNILFTKNFGGSAYDDIRDIVRTNANDGIVAVGTTSSLDNDVSNSNGGFDAWMFQMHDSGSLEWSKAFGTSGSDAANFITSNGSDKYYACQYHGEASDGDANEAFGSLDAWYFAVNEQGSLTEQDTFGGSLSDQLFSVLIDSQGKTFFIGQTASTDFDIQNNNGSSDILFIKK